MKRTLTGQDVQNALENAKRKNWWQEVALPNIRAVERRIGVTFKHPDLLCEALTHRSYLNENQMLHRRHNERLEFLGDAVLELIVTEHLIRQEPPMDEGRMTALRSALVNALALAHLAEDLGVSEFLFLSRGERKSFQQGMKARLYIMANALEAILGAIYMDRGFGGAELFCHEFVLPKLEKIVSEGSWQDPKSKLQDLVQGKYRVTPSYAVIAESGPDHEKQFRVRVLFGNLGAGEGTGPSKQEAEAAAASHALARHFDMKAPEPAKEA